MNYRRYFGILLIIAAPFWCQAQGKWQSRYVKQTKDSSLLYLVDVQGNTIPDFSGVGYHRQSMDPPVVRVFKEIRAGGNDDQEMIQSAIDELSKVPLDHQGFRGAILLKEGVYKIPGTIKISTSGIVLRGEGEKTRLIATGKGQRKLISVIGQGNLEEIAGSRVKIYDKYVPVGSRSFRVAETRGLKKGDAIIVYRPGTAKWIADLKMDSIAQGEGTVQWQKDDYNFNFERRITAIKGDTVEIDQPIVMAMEDQYGGGEIYKYRFEGRINEVGIEELSLESEFVSDTDEDHGWDAIYFNKVEHAWVRKVISRNFGYSCVNLGGSSKNITVSESKCLSPKSQIIGGRRYSFNNDGQQNLFMNCYSSEGRHDYVTGAKVCGPNVFYNCVSVNAKADIGPHHRWAMGTLYDNIVTDGEINIQDRGNWGTGHGWAGVTQVLWNCTAAKASVQQPYVSGQNYSIGLKGNKTIGRLKGRPEGSWEGNNRNGLEPGSLYIMQLKAAKKRAPQITGL
ncbi:hypothetical protein [Pedobacter sp. GR22-6]|uniref:hypothetical protein n=1 Tax=Pedobacter sp. GR22-6 TaxID=3127957 RepID=UPI00307E1BEC